MPKIIPNLKNQILENARDMLLSEGYSAMSMRALARRCGIVPGTLYNYFPSKDELVACITMEDWDICLERMALAAGEAASMPDGFSRLCSILMEFVARFRGVWEQYGGGGRAVGYAARFHHVLRRQLAAPIETVLSRTGGENLLPLSAVLAEALLSCALYPDLGADQFGLLASSWTPDGNKSCKGDQL